VRYTTHANVYRGDMDLTVLPNQTAVFERTADIVEQFIRSNSTVSLGLSGGSGPPHIHASLAKRDITWDNVSAWISDERWVPPDHEASNQGMARRTLVDPTGVRLLAPDTTLESPHDAADLFEATLVDADIGGQTPSLLMLGMGADGHTASLFPDTDALGISNRSYVANWVERHDTWRLTATYQLIATSDLIVIVVTGQSKAEMVAEISRGRDVPIAHITCRGDVLWIVDEEAASEV
jgi:6-phosphogluconolactonase